MPCLILTHQENLDAQKYCVAYYEKIENPFGRDYNDLPLDRLCATIENNVNELINTEPHYHRV